MVSTAKDGLKMAKKSAVSYAGLSLGTDQGNAGEVLVQNGTPLPERQAERAGGRTLKEVAANLMLYVDPAAVKALKRYALDQNVKVHDLLIEAVEDWFRAHGLKEQVRAHTVRRNVESNRPEGKPTIT